MRWARSDKEVDIRERKGAPRPKFADGQPCRKCDTPIYLKPRKQKGINKSIREKSYYFTHFFKCDGCGTAYFDEAYKVMNN